MVFCSHTAISLLFFICSQKNFVAIILVLSVFFMQFFARPNFRLTHLTFRPQERDKQVAPSEHLVLLELFSSVLAQTVLETYSYGVKGGS